MGWKICDFDAAAPAHHRHFQWHCLTPQQAEKLCGSVYPVATEAPTCPSYMYDCGDSLLGNVTQKCVYQVASSRSFLFSQSVRRSVTYVSWLVLTQGEYICGNASAQHAIDVYTAVFSSSPLPNFSLTQACEENFMSIPPIS